MKLPLLLLALLTLTSCATPITAQQAADLQNGAATATQASADLHAIRAATPANDPVGKAAGKGAAAIDKGLPVLTGAANAAAQAGATVLDVGAAVLTGAAPLVPPPYGLYVGIAGLLLAEWQRRQKNTAKAATQSVVDGVTAGIGNGSITVTPKAAATVDAHITDHPMTNQLVDTMTAAAATQAKG